MATVSLRGGGDCLRGHKLKPSRTTAHATADSNDAEFKWRCAVLAELRAIHVLLERQHQRRPSTMTRTDRTRLAAMLPAIAGALGSEPFASRDLVADDAAPALRVVCRTLSIRQIGKLLARAEGMPIDEWLVERCGVEINVTLWRIVRSVSHG
jgi:hypothetical protein